MQNSRKRCGAEHKNGDPWENRTPDFAVRGRRLSRLTNRPYLLLSFTGDDLLIFPVVPTSNTIHHLITKCKHFFQFFLFFFKTLINYIFLLPPTTYIFTMITQDRTTVCPVILPVTQPYSVLKYL